MGLPAAAIDYFAGGRYATPIVAALEFEAFVTSIFAPDILAWGVLSPENMSRIDHPVCPSPF
jgi:hypothetical protein